MQLQVSQAQSVVYEINWAWVIFSTVVILFFVVVSGHICGKVAQAWGGEYWLFFPLGFYFNIVGVVITILVYIFERLPGAGESETAGGARRILPDAPEAQPPTGMVETGLSATPPPDSAYSGGAVLCPKCKSGVPKGEEFCWNCGSMIRAPKDRNP